MSEIIRVAVLGMTGNKGGIESVMMNIYRNIDREKIQFDFVLHHDAGKMAYEEEAIGLGARIFRIIYSERESFRKSRACLLKYFNEHPEVKVVHLNSNYPYAFPLKMAKKAGVPIRILHAHSSAILFETNKSLKAKIKTIRNKIVYRQVDKYPNLYFSCSDLASKSTFRENKYVWIKNGIDLEKFGFDVAIRKEKRQEYQIEDSETVIGFIGKLCYHKNPIYALEIFHEYLKQNPNSKFVYVGEGEYTKRIRKKIEELGIQDKVIMAGSVNDTYKWYQAFDLFLLPSLFEGLPVVLVEAQAAGLPAISSDTVTKQVDVTDIVKYKSIEESPEKWASEINNMILVEAERSKYKDWMMEAGFDIKSMAEQVQKYYLEANK